MVRRPDIDGPKPFRASGVRRPDDTASMTLSPLSMNKLVYGITEFLTSGPGDGKNVIVAVGPLGSPRRAIDHRARKARTRGKDLIVVQFPLKDPFDEDTALVEMICIFALGNRFVKVECLPWTSSVADPVVMVPVDPEHRESYVVGNGGRFVSIAGRPAAAVLSSGTELALERMLHRVFSHSGMPPEQACGSSSSVH